jgi:hypothetical protein
MAAFVPSLGFGLSSPAEQNGFKFTAELFRGVVPMKQLHEIAMSGPVTPADGAGRSALPGQDCRRAGDGSSLPCWFCAVSAISGHSNRGNFAMAYFPKKLDGIEKGGKVVADVACALLLVTFSIVFFGLLGGVVAFIILEAALLAVDYLVPNEEDDTSGAVVR